MDSWERFNETSLLDKIYFYSELNNEDISDKDYEHYKNIQEVFEIKNLGEYHDLYVQCNTLLLEMYLKTLETSVLKYMDLILLIFLSTPGLAWQVCLKKTRVELELLTDIDILLMVEKGFGGGIC